MKSFSATPITRLKKRRDFVRLTKRGGKIVAKGFVLQHIKTEENSIRLGFTASKKIGNAVKRNRAKRRLRAVSDELMRLNPRFTAPHNMDINLVARYSTGDIPYETLLEQLKKSLLELKCTI